MTKIAIFGDSFAANPHTEALSSPTTEGFIKKIYAINNRKYKEGEVSKPYYGANEGNRVLLF